MSKRILVLRGGPSSEFEVSLRSGKAIIETLKNKHSIKDCVIDKQGNWVIDGMIVSPNKATMNTDLVFNAMHGEYGEDGTVQNLLENLGVKFTGPNSFGAKMSINKATAKKIYKQFGLKTPIAILIERTEDLDNLAINLFRSFPMPMVLKPADKGSSVGVTIARDYNSLINSLKSLFVYHDKLIVEEYIPGKEATLGVIQEFRNKDIYSLMPIEIRKPKDKDFFDYESKYSGTSLELCPGDFSLQERDELAEMTKMAHKILGLRHYSRSDFIIHPKRGIYILETNSLPGLTQESLMPKGVKAIGSSFEEFLDHVIDLAK
jgi:D-alanine-D-alanine ligase